MTKIENSNGELLKELQKLQERHNSLKSLYNKHLHKRKILQELSRERNEKLSESNALLEIAKEKTIWSIIPPNSTIIEKEKIYISDYVIQSCTSRIYTKYK